MTTSISIHVPLAGNDAPSSEISAEASTFQSTFPSRGTTFLALLTGKNHVISIHVPLAGNDSGAFAVINLDKNFNPRSPRGERLKLYGNGRAMDEFQSTFPSRGTTLPNHSEQKRRQISIHVPLAGNDIQSEPATRKIFHFNPRSPRGERPLRTAHFLTPFLFQSTFPSRGTT